MSLVFTTTREVKEKRQGYFAYLFKVVSQSKLEKHKFHIYSYKSILLKSCFLKSKMLAIKIFFFSFKFLILL